MDDKKEAFEYAKAIGTSMELDSCIETMRSQFQMSDNQIAMAFREKALELAPRKRVKVIKVTESMLKKMMRKEGEGSHA